MYYLSARTSGSEEESILRGEAGVLRRDGGKTQVAERRHRVLLFAGKEETNQSWTSGSSHDKETWALLFHRAELKDTVVTSKNHVCGHLLALLQCHYYPSECSHQ